LISIIVDPFQKESLPATSTFYLWLENHRTGLNFVFGVKNDEPFIQRS